MSVNDALDELEKIIASAWRIPMTKGKCAVSIDEMQNLIDDIRLSLPKEIKQAKIIVEDRNNILSDAREEAKNITKNARKQREHMINETEVMKQAKRDASQIIISTRHKTNEMREKTNEYIEKAICSCDKLITDALRNFKASSNEIKKIIKKSNFKF